MLSVQVRQWVQGGCTLHGYHMAELRLDPKVRHPTHEAFLPYTAASAASIQTGMSATPSCCLLLRCPVEQLRPFSVSSEKAQLELCGWPDWAQLTPVLSPRHYPRCFKHATANPQQKPWEVSMEGSIAPPLQMRKLSLKENK